MSYPFHPRRLPKLTRRITLTNIPARMAHSDHWDFAAASFQPTTQPVFCLSSIFSSIPFFAVGSPENRFIALVLSCFLIKIMEKIPWTVGGRNAEQQKRKEKKEIGFWSGVVEPFVTLFGWMQIVTTFESGRESGFGIAP